MEPNQKQVTNRPSQDGSSHAKDSTRSQTFAALLSGSAIDPSAAQNLVEPLSTPYALIALRPSPNAAYDIRSIQDLAKVVAPHAVILQEDGLFVALVSQMDARRFAESVLEKGSSTRPAIALSLPFDTCTDVPQQYRLIKYSLDEYDGSGLVETKNSALQYLKSEILGAIDVKGLLHPALAKLAQYDESNQSNLLNTLRVYLMYDRNAQRCANVLYLHRNSLQYRVRRIQEIADVNLENPEDRAYLRLSFFLGDAM